ncbi:hypothetical protein ACFY1P_32725 [Streptomyces sp. NPDC001407]|uniref:hypothetical protein n=1 Tax=Streptomyces sp. NPDC001407 TaxID=3364573 RepID=UPI00369947EF
MPSTTMKPALHHIESAAVQAAMRRARTGQAMPLGPDPAVHLSDDELSGMAQVLRHRLRLDTLSRPVVIRRAPDSLHPLLAGGQHYRAIALSIPLGGRALGFLAAYNDRRRLIFDITAPCPHCRESVPTEEINRLEDLGDYLLQARDFLGGSPRFRSSPAHTANCPARGD